MVFRQVQLLFVGREFIVPAIQHVDKLPVQFFGNMKEGLPFFLGRIQDVGGDVGFLLIQTAVVSQIAQHMRIGHEHRVQHMVCLHAEDPAQISTPLFPGQKWRSCGAYT